MTETKIFFTRLSILHNYKLNGESGRIISAPGKGVTSQYPANAQISASHDPIFFYNLNSVGGTGWVETTTGRKKWGYKILISFQESNKETLRQPLHLSFKFHEIKILREKEATALQISLGWDSENPGRTAKTISIDCGYCSGCNRKDSLTIRLMRFLLTAPRIFRCTLIPSRLLPEKFALHTNVKPSPCKRLPLLYTLSNSHPFLRRELLRN